MKLVLFTLMLTSPLLAGHKFPGCHPTGVHVPCPRFKKKPIYTPSIYPEYSPLDIDVPIVKRCPSSYPVYPPYGPALPYPRGRINSKKNSNVIKGYIQGSKINMSNEGSGNVQSNMKKNVKINARGKGKGKKKCKKGGRKGGRGKRPKRIHPYGYPSYGYPPYGGINSKKNLNKIEGHVIGSKVNMSNEGYGNVQSNMKKNLKVKGGWGKGGKGCGKGGRGGHHGYGGYRPYPYYPVGGINSVDNKNVIKGVVVGSDINMSNGGYNNVQSNSKENVDINIKKKKKCRKKRHYIGDSK